jgi:hypothetical protein
LFFFLVDEVFEVEAKRLLNISERMNESISRITVSNDQVILILSIYYFKIILFIL